MSFKTLWRVLLPLLGVWLLSATAANAMFLSTDPIGTKEDPSLYMYVGLDPVNETDPTGKCPNCITGAIGAGLGAITGGGWEAGAQLLEHGRISDWNRVGATAVGGAVAGGVLGATGQPTLAGIAGGAATELADGAIRNGRISGSDVRRAATGAVIGGTVGRLVPSANGRGGMRTNVVARNERYANMARGRIAQGQQSLTPRTAARIGADAAARSVVPTVVASGSQRVAECRPNRQC